MDKVVKQEIKLTFTCLECGKFFTTWHNGEGWVSTVCSKCYIINNTTGEKESEKSVNELNIYEEAPTVGASPTGSSDSNDSFWDSVDVMDLTPTQRKHFKEIMRKEVKND